MTVDFIFDGLNQLFPELAGNDIFLIIAMLLPVAGLLGFITIYGFGVIYSEIKSHHLSKIKLAPWVKVLDSMLVNGDFCNL